MIYNIRTKELDIDKDKKVKFDVITDDLVEKKKENKLINKNNISVKIY